MVAVKGRWTRYADCEWMTFRAVLTPKNAVANAPVMPIMNYFQAFSYPYTSTNSMDEDAGGVMLLISQEI